MNPDQIAILLEDDAETLEEHLEVILEIVMHLWNMLTDDQRAKLDHYRRAIGRANWALQSRRGNAP